LQHPWGIVNKDSKTFWIADNQTSVITQYNKDGSWTGVQPVTVTGQNPTGLVNNTTNSFVVNGAPATLITATENGTIDVWNSNTGSSTISVSRTLNAVYKGLDILNGNLCVANFSNGTVDVFDGTFAWIASFTDAELVDTGYAPYNVYAQSGKLYVSFAKQDALKLSALPGDGNGYIDVFDSNGVLLKRLVNRGYLNVPWGMLAIEVSNSKRKLKLLLVANNGSGVISIYDRKTGTLLKTLKDKFLNDILIDNLRSIVVINNSANTGNSTCTVKQGKVKCNDKNKNKNNNNGSTIYFTAGINLSANGLFGMLNKTNVNC
jgi:uncharacterized protein (TIGR03118 family)